MAREDGANDKLRQLVEQLKRTELPAPFQSIEEAQRELGEEQLHAFSTFCAAVEQYNEVAGEGQPQEGTPWWDGILELRKQLQVALEAGLIRMPLIQKLAFDYGALPDPEVGWKYYRLPSGQYACWGCGTGIMQKQVRNSVWHAEMRGCAGSGEVRSLMVPYCPTCDQEPRDGVVMETLQESLARDHQFVRAARRAQ